MIDQDEVKAFIKELVKDYEFKNLVRSLVRDAIWQVMDHRTMRSMIRQMVLMTVLEQNEIGRHGAVRTFIRECAERNIDLELDGEGKIVLTNHGQLGELRAVLVMYRDDITDHLKRLRELEEGAARRQEKHK